MYDLVLNGLFVAGILAAVILFWKFARGEDRLNIVLRGAMMIAMIIGAYFIDVALHNHDKAGNNVFLFFALMIGLILAFFLKPKKKPQPGYRKGTDAQASQQFSQLGIGAMTSECPPRSRY